MSRRIAWGFVVVSMLIAACGGIDDIADQIEDASSQGGGAGSDSGGASDGGSDDGGSGADLGVSAVDTVNATADAGTAFVEVDGQRFVYTSAEAVGFRCEISGDQAQVGFQTADGDNLSFRANRQGDAWDGQMTIGSREDFTTEYMGGLFDRTGTLGATEGALSYEGTIDRVVDRDVMNAEETDIVVAINCGPPGGSEPTAVIGGTTYEVAYNGAQSITCLVGEDNIDITVNRLFENLQFSLDVRGGPGDWIGSVFIITPDGKFTAVLQGEAEGLTIDGLSLDYEGPIEAESGDILDATASITCPEPDTPSS